jgi:hypothetical protein
MAKVAPGVDDDTIGDWDATFVSVNGDLVEALLTSHGSTMRRASLFDQETTANTMLIGGNETATAELGAFLITPDTPLVRARALSVLAERCAAGLVNPHIAWLTSNDRTAVESLVHDTPRIAQAFEILNVVPFSPKTLKRDVAQHEASALTIMTRGVQVNVDELRKKISGKLQKSAPELVVAIYRDDAGNKAILARRI